MDNTNVMHMDFNQEQVNLIKSQIAPKATDTELQLFLYQAKRTGLDPLTRQIYCIHRNTKDEKGNWVAKMTIQTSIDGFRVIAERSGDYAGQNEPEFIEENGRLVACKVAVFRFRGDVRYQAAVGVAYWGEYAQTNKDGQPTGLWAKMPHAMLSKVAEALALRKAYPQDLSGLYTGEEMAQTDIPTMDITHEEVMDIDVWKEQVNQCKDTAELRRLFKANEAAVNANKEIFNLFSYKKTELVNATKEAA